MEDFRNTALSARQRAEDLLKRLTLREKVGQINQRLYGFSAYVRRGDDFVLSEECVREIERWGGLGVLYGLYRADPWSGKNETNGIPPYLAAKAYNLVQREVMRASRFGIPVLMSGDASHGMMAVGGYILPVNLAMAATFNPSLCRQAFQVYGRQAAHQGVDFALMAGLDVLRDPRWGRSEECFGEDPFLAACMVRQAVEGCTAEGPDVVAKHFCGQGETTGGINASACRVGWRELREIHLPPTQAALEGGASGVMAAYNEIDGVPCHANPRLLRDYLREECGFTGVVMADGTAIDRLDEITGDNMLSGALALDSGVDISLWDTGFTHLEEAVRSGAVSEERLDEAVLRVLEVKFRRGLFEHPFLDENAPVPSFPVEEFPQSLEAARQSVVLLENHGEILPLGSAPGKIAVIGPNGDSLYNQLGDYSPPMRKDEGVTVLEGLRQQFGAGQVFYEDGCGTLTGTQEQLRRAVELAKSCDVVVLVLGGSSNRFGDVEFDETGAAIPGGEIRMDCGEGVDRADLDLPDCQLELFRAVRAAGTPVVCVVMGGRPYVVTPFAQQADALLVSFYPGPYGGRAIAEILAGVQNPSGRLPVSMPRHSGALPCWYNGKYAAKNRVYCDMDSAALYPFGFGRSYTQFKAHDIQAQVQDGEIRVSFDLENAGSRDACAVPMLFIRWMRGCITARKKEHKAFEKVAVPAGQRVHVTLTVPKQQLMRWVSEDRQEPGQGPVCLMLEEGGTRLWDGSVAL